MRNNNLVINHFLFFKVKLRIRIWPDRGSFIRSDFKKIAVSGIHFFSFFEGRFRVFIGEVSSKRNNFVFFDIGLDYSVRRYIVYIIFGRLFNTLFHIVVML